MAKIALDEQHFFFNIYFFSLTVCKYDGKLTFVHNFSVFFDLILVSA